MKAFLNKKSTSSNSKIYTPDNIISSYIELPNGVDPTEAIWHTSSIALDTEQICFVYSTADDGVYFIASPANYFLGKDKFSTPLAAALPNNPLHKGDGAYICAIGTNLFAVVLKDKKSLSCFIGDKNSVLQFADGKEQFWVDKGSDPWKSLTQYKQKNTVLLMSAISTVSFALMIGMFAGSLYLKSKTQEYLSTIQDKQNNMSKMQEQNVLIMNAKTKNTPVNIFLKKYLELASVVGEQNGRIISYEYKTDHIKYTVELPATTVDLSFYGKNTVPVVKDDLMTIEKEETL